MGEKDLTKGRKGPDKGQKRSQRMSGKDLKKDPTKVRKRSKEAAARMTRGKVSSKQKHEA
jgi:hypothetical protein